MQPTPMGNRILTWLNVGGGSSSGNQRNRVKLMAPERILNLSQNKTVNENLCGSLFLRVYVVPEAIDTNEPDAPDSASSTQ